MLCKGGNLRELIAYCGLHCHTCPIYVAAQEQDKSKKSELVYEIIRMCRKRYGIEYRFSEIICDGCTSANASLFTGCRNCEIRRCAIEKDIVNCAYCNEYACDLLSGLFSTDQMAKTHLDEIRSKL